VSQAGRELGDSLRSLTFISPVFDPGCIASQDFEQHWSGRPVLVISGAKDDRVEMEYVTDNVRTMTQAGVHVTFKKIEDADHFMLFSHRARVLQTMIDWLRSQATKESKVPTK
jgi:pimeloyl-ACP methyl ester carboxylesterase